MNAHQLDAAGVVINTIVVENLDTLPNLIDAALGGKLGDRWDGLGFITPAPKPPEVPQKVTMRQARLALMQSGKLANVAAAIASLPSPQRETAEIEWEFSSEVFRHRELVVLLGAALQLTEQGLDDLFILAATL